MQMREYTKHGAPLAGLERKRKLGDSENAHSLEKTRNASELGNKPGVMDSGDLDTGIQEKARSIAEGIQAWKKLTAQKVPDPTGAADATAAADPPAAPSTVASNQSSLADGSGPGLQKHSDTSYSTRQKGDAEEGRKCPFASTFGSMPVGHPNTDSPDSGSQRPDSLPTRPEMSRDPNQSPKTSKRKSADLSSASPSAAGSASKCPIRFLDHYSPEEVAAYFENHKHEIPRSHEVCVKRYQSNAESIRQLDAKYGNLVNMIQGLGAKHQPLLPAKDEEESSQAFPGKSIEKIKNWAEGVDDTAGEGVDGADQETVPKTRLDAGTEADNDATEHSNLREGRFQRPLREVRVGESPSRPCGVSVPLPYNSDDQLYTQPAAEGRASQTSLLQERPTSSVAAAVGTQGATSQPRDREQPKMIFTGPVFLGYSPEQAASLLQQNALAGRIPKH